MKVIHVVAAIIKKDKEVFIAKRGYGEFKGKWEFPGGKIEAKETCEEAVVREIKEELEADIEVEKFFCEINDDRGDVCFNVKFYICKLLNSRMKIKEHTDSLWVRPKDIAFSDFMEADKEVIQKLVDEYDC